ncbi:MAG TPA: DNA polymerase III subunit delta [Candidatus Nealsonbacteria bacterium]|uniref:DNA polymerase III subunit delta n=1 Tax=marine sediment metagenome TaxID=412755 RepID=A0A0F9UZC0_9ZZZZ|nr:DNA polymerase III subunit delta [Candidatus Nealsonbacteria bacterium]HEB46240.1 DNA polymerase III subunit delta [Candidatus Nealsonbacteria bacterium]
MIIFLYGQDTYRSRQKVNEIVDHYKKTYKDGFNLKHFDFKKDDYNDFQNEIQSIPMFAGKKLIVLKNAILNENFQTNFIKDSKKLINSKDIILFYEDKDIPVKGKLFKFLKKHVKSQEFRSLSGQPLINWVKKEFKNLGSTIDQKPLEKLIAFIGNDLWRLNKEIQKLVAYKYNQKIETNDIELLIRPKIETDIFKTIDAIAARNRRSAFSLIHQHLEKGDSPLYLLSMINFQFRNLLIMKSHKFNTGYLSTSPKRWGMHPYVARKAVEQSRKFSLDELKKIYQKIFQFDLAIKTGKVDAKTALDLLVAEI